MLKRSIFLSLLFLSPAVAMANPGAYTQLELGSVSVHPDSGSSNNPFDNAGFGARLSAGYLWGSNNFNYGLESGVLYFPNSTINDSESVPGIDQKFEGYNIDLLGVLKYNFDSGVNVFGKAGVAYMHQDYSASVNLFGQNFSINSSDSKFAPEAALGVGYQFTPQLEADLTTAVTFPGNATFNSPVARTESVMAGITYHFA